MLNRRFPKSRSQLTWVLSKVAPWFLSGAWTRVFAAALAARDHNDVAGLRISYVNEDGGTGTRVVRRCSLRSSKIASVDGAQ
jgi:hypothetical protein